MKIDPMGVLALICLAVFLGGAGVLYAASPDPPPGSTKPVTIVKRDYVCAFTMERIDEDAGHVYWQVGAKRWCKWVAR